MQRNFTPTLSGLSRRNRSRREAGEGRKSYQFSLWSSCERKNWSCSEKCGEQNKGTTCLPFFVYPFNLINKTSWMVLQVIWKFSFEEPMWSLFHSFSNHLLLNDFSKLIWGNSPSYFLRNARDFWRFFASQWRELISPRSAIVQLSEHFGRSGEFGEPGWDTTFTNPEFFNRGNEIEAFIRGEK